MSLLYLEYIKVGDHHREVRNRSPAPPFPHRKLFTMPTSFVTPKVKIWVKARAASPADNQVINREKGAITILRSELFMGKSFSSLSFLNPEAHVP